MGCGAFEYSVKSVGLMVRGAPRGWPTRRATGHAGNHPPRTPVPRTRGFAADPDYWKGEVFAYVGLPQTLKDLKDRCRGIFNARITPAVGSYLGV